AAVGLTVPVTVTAPVATATVPTGPVIAAVCARAAIVVAAASRRSQRKRFMAVRVARLLLRVVATTGAGLGAGGRHDGRVLEKRVGGRALEVLLFRRAAGAYEIRGNEDEQVPFLRTLALRLEQPADERKIAQKGHLVGDLLHLLAREAAHDERGAVPDRDLRRDVADGENRLEKPGRHGDGGAAGDGDARAAVFHEALELGDLRVEVRSEERR